MKKMFLMYSLARTEQAFKSIKNAPLICYKIQQQRDIQLFFLRVSEVVLSLAGG